VSGQHSAYISNLHSGNLAARFALAKRVDLFVGYSRVQDAGDGRGSSGLTNLPSLFAGVQTYPVAFESPFARLSLRINTRLRWNAGYQYYRYFEEFSTVQDYRANTGFTSLTWSF
jgi:hypothetical protein